MTNVAKVLINSGKAIKIGKDVYDFYDGKCKPVWQISKHINHLERGENHNSNCEICTGE